MKVCECKRISCRARFPLTHAQYVRLTVAGQRVVANGHIDHSRERAVAVVCDGAALVVEPKSPSARIRAIRALPVERPAKPARTARQIRKASIMANLPASFTEPREMYEELLDEYTVEEMARIVSGL